MKKKAFAILLAAATVIQPTGVAFASEDATAETSLAFEPYEEELNISLGRLASEHTVSSLYKGDTLENNPYTRYIKDKLNITFTDVIEADGDDYKKQIALATAAGELPDVFTVTDYDLLVDLVDSGLIYDMTDYYEEYASDYIKSIYDSYDGRCLGNVTFDGKLMCLPGANPDNGVPVLCWVRKDWLDKLDYNPDEDGDLCISIDDIEELAKKFMEADLSGKGTIGIAASDSIDDIEWLYEGMGGFGNKWIQNEDGTIENTTFANDSVKNAWERMNKWYEEGILDPQFGTRTWDDVTSLLINGQLGIAFGPWHTSDWRLVHVKDADPEAEYIAYTIKDADGKVNSAHENAASSYIVVNKDFEHPEAAVKILNVLFDELAQATDESAPEVLQFIDDGGDNFCRPFQIEVLSAGNVQKYWDDHYGVMTGTITPEEAQTTENRTSCKALLNYMDYMENPEGKEWNTEILFGWKTYTSRIVGCGAAVNALNQNGNGNWISPLYPPTLPVMEQKQETLNTILLQAYIKIVTGEEPISYFDELKTMWSENGGDEIIAELEDYYSAN